MNTKPFHKLAAQLFLWTTFQFVILTLLAMVAYPGGHAHDPEMSHYSFTYNYFSDLGSTKTFAGKENLLSQMLFVVALGGAGVGMISFAFTTKIYIQGFEKRMLSNIATLMLGLSGGCFVATAALPLDLYLSEHIFFMKTAFSLLLLYTVAIWSLQVQSGWPRPYVWANMIYMLSLVAYVYILFRGPSYETVAGLQFQVVSQKVIAYLSILNLGYQALGILKKTKPLPMQEAA